MIIYKAVNKINGNTYIGKTILSLHQRKTGHLNYVNNQNSETYFHRAIRKYGKENFEWLVLTETNSESKLNILEKFYIAMYQKMTQLYNMTDGGEGTKLCGEKNGFYGKKHTKETKEHWSKIRKGVKNPNLGRSRYGEKNNFYGKKHTEETKKKISEKGKGKNNGIIGENHPMYGKTGKKHPRSKAVHQIDKHTNKTIKEWESINLAEKELKIRHISDCCNGLLKTVGGFKWKYV